MVCLQKQLYIDPDQVDKKKILAQAKTEVLVYFMTFILVPLQNITVFKSCSVLDLCKHAYIICYRKRQSEPRDFYVRRWDWILVELKLTSLSILLKMKSTSLSRDLRV